MSDFSSFQFPRGFWRRGVWGIFHFFDSNVLPPRMPPDMSSCQAMPDFTTYSLQGSILEDGIMGDLPVFESLRDCHQI